MSSFNDIPNSVNFWSSISIHFSAGMEPMFKIAKLDQQIIKILNSTPTVNFENLIYLFI